MRKVNWIGLSSAASMLFILYMSLAHGAPWWRLEVGGSLGSVNVSPLDIEVKIMGSAIDVPLLGFVTFGSKVSWVIVAAMMLAYSLDLSPRNSGELLGFSYRKPTYYVVGMILVGLVGRLVVGSFLPVEVPLVGVSTASFRFEGGTVSVPIRASITWVFWAAVVCAALSLGARLCYEGSATVKANLLRLRDPVAVPNV